MIEWPSLVFPPVNLNSAPIRWPKDYLELESKYCEEDEREFLLAVDGTLHKEICRKAMLDKREEFNRLWNMRARG